MAVMILNNLTTSTLVFANMSWVYTYKKCALLMCFTLSYPDFYLLTSLMLFDL